MILSEKRLRKRTRERIVFIWKMFWTYIIMKLHRKHYQFLHILKWTHLNNVADTWPFGNGIYLKLESIRHYSYLTFVCEKNDYISKWLWERTDCNKSKASNENFRNWTTRDSFRYMPLLLSMRCGWMMVQQAATTLTLDGPALSRKNDVQKLSQLMEYIQRKQWPNTIQA